MKQTIVVFDTANGTLEGFKDVKQAAAYLGISKGRLMVNLTAGVHYAGTRIVGRLNLRKSNRGGDRTKKLY